jgi:hypothetical protein
MELKEAGGERGQVPLHPRAESKSGHTFDPADRSFSLLHVEPKSGLARAQIQQADLSSA